MNLTRRGLFKVTAGIGFGSMLVNAPALARAQSNGSVAVAMSQDITTLDAHNATYTADFAALGNIFETLIYFDANTNPVGLLAESWEAVSDTEWDFQLRTDVVFQNGESFDAEVVKFNVDRYKESDKGRYPSVGAAISSATVMDSHTVRFTTPKPDPIFLSRLRNMLIVPMGYAQEVGDEGMATAPVGSGPFTFVEWVQNDHFTLAGNADYWGGGPAIETLTFRIIPEIATRVAALNAGEVQLITQLTPDQIGPLEETEELGLISVEAPRVVQVGFNAGIPEGEPLKDVRVRQAINAAIDKQAIVDAILGGQGTPVATLAAPNAGGFDPNVAMSPYDPEAAQRLLEEAGYGGGLELEFAVPTGGSVLKPVEVATILVAYWEAVGIKVSIKPLETGTWIKERDERTISPLFLWNWVGLDVINQLSTLGTSSAWFYNPVAEDVQAEFDRLIGDAESNIDETLRNETLSQLQQLAVDEMATIGLYQQNDLYGVNQQLTGVEITSTGLLVFQRASIE